jgi:hypothetical protein
MIMMSPVPGSRLDSTGQRNKLSFLTACAKAFTSTIAVNAQ